jgi:hypothetical protein
MAARQVLDSDTDNRSTNNMLEFRAVLRWENLVVVVVAALAVVRTAMVMAMPPLLLLLLLLRR